MYGRSMQVDQAFQADLGTLTPGPELAALLTGLDLSAVPDDHVVGVLQATNRQIAQLQALSWAAMVEIGRREPADELPSHPAARAAALRRAATAAGQFERTRDSWEWCSNQIAPALTCTVRHADEEYGLAQQVRNDLPLVWAALHAGDIDRAKAKVFAQYLINLTPEQVDRISRRLLPGAPRWTTGQLAHRLLREIMAIDPGYAERRYARANKARRVWGYIDHDGTAVLTAHGLSPTDAAAAAERLEQLASAVRAAGHPDAEEQLRADLFIRLLDGRFTALTRDQIIAAMLAEADASTNADADAAAEAPTGTDADTGHSGGDPNPGRRPADPVPAQRTPAPAPTPEAERSAAAARPPTRPEPERAAPPPAVPAPAAAVRTGIEVRVGLTTLLGPDDHPAELPGWGPVVAENARLLVSRQHGAEWRFAVLDQRGYLRYGGLTRRRPTGGPGRRTPDCRGGVVEIHIRAAELTHLAGRDDLPADWLAVVADIARQYGDRRPALNKLKQLDRCPQARFPHIGLRRHIQMRDRTCAAPGCRRPASTAEQDHTVDYARGGATVRANLAPLCRRHHRMKGRGWRLVQPWPGIFRWQSPLGQTYWTRGEPIAPDLPAPLPGPEPDETDSTPGPDPDPAEPIFHPYEWQKLRPPDPPPAPPAPDDGPPPF